MSNLFLRIVLSLGLICLAGSVWAQSTECKKLDAIVAEGRAIDGDVAFTPMTASEISKFREESKHWDATIPEFITSIVVGKFPRISDRVTFFAFKQTGCLDGSGMIGTGVLKAVIDADDHNYDDILGVKQGDPA